MNINLITLNTRKKVDFDEDLDLSSYSEINLKEIKNAHVKGTIIDNDTDEYEVKMNITGDLVLISAVNGSDVNKHFDIEYDDFVEN